MTDENDDWTPRPDAWTLLVRVSGTEVQNHGEYTDWMDRLRQAVGADVSPGRKYHQTECPWAIATTPYGSWEKDHYGLRYLDRIPRANLWQNIEGQVVSAAMAHVWAALHLVAPIEAAGFTTDTVNVQLTDMMVLLA